ncbi:GD24866 [Drosophila simulans]|uniref:GD24866 n=2 Tax=melanogaster subgroup TaxID=32351 RepID=B4NUP5_DROSI|nr:GD24866 [Drosophila simulans]
MASCGEDQGIGMTLAVGGGGGGGMMTPMHEGSGVVGAGSLSPFNYPRRCSADQQRASGRSMASAVGVGPGVGMAVGGMGGGSMSMSSSSNVALSTGAKPKKNFWTMKP